MAFDPLTWAGGLVVKAAGKALLEKYGPGLPEKITHCVKEWAEKLPVGLVVEPAALLPKLEASDLPVGPAVQRLQTTLTEQHIPIEIEWSEALEESRVAVGAKLGPNQAEAFFLLDPAVARQHIDALAMDLHRICKQDEKLFKATLIDSVIGTRTSEVHAEIEGAASFIKDGKADFAITLLTKIKDSRWNSLGTDDRLRLLIALGQAQERKGNLEEAARLYLKLKSVAASDERAYSYEAVAYCYLGDHAKACELAQAALIDHPTSSIAAAVWVRTAPEGTPADEIAKKIHAAVKDHLDVLASMGERALASNDPAAAERLARAALKQKADLPELKAQLATAIVMAEADGFNVGRKPDRPRLDEAISQLTDAVGRYQSAWDISRLRNVRAVAYELIGARAKAEAEYLAAIDGSPDVTEFVDSYVSYLLKQGRTDHAIEVLEEAIGGNADPTLQVTLALLLGERNQPEDRPRAKKMLLEAVPVITATEPRSREQLCDALVQIYCLGGEPEKALSLFDDLPQQYVTETVRLVFEADVFRRLKLFPQAVERAVQALVSLGPDPDYMDSLRVANALTDVKRHDLAVALWIKALERPRIVPFTRKALWSVEQCERYDIILSFCERLRANGVFDPFFIETEVRLALHLHDYERAIPLIQDYTTRHPNDELTKGLRTCLSLIGLRHGRPELVESDVARLPDVNTVPLRLGAQTAHVLSEGPNPEAGVRYAYALLRNHFSEIDAHRAYLWVVGASDEMTSRFPKPTVVVPGCAVAFKADDEDNEHWRIIEDLDAPKIERNEIGPNDQLAVELAGKEVDQQFALRRDPVQPRSAKVIAILDKHVFRKLDVLRRGEERFGDDAPARMYNFGTKSDGSLSLDVITKSLDIQEATTSLLDEMYRNNDISVTTFAQLAQASVLASLYHLASDGKAPIKCCFGNDPEWAASGDAVQRATELVIDPTGLATLYFGERVEDLAYIPLRCVVLEGALEEFREHVETLASPPAGFTGKYRGRYYFEERSEQSEMGALERTTGFLNRLKQLTDIKHGHSLANLEPTTRRQMVTIFGEAATQCVAYAKDKCALLWTDDLGIAEFARHTFDLPRVWTQRLFAHAKDMSSLPQSSFVDLTLHLLQWNYTFTRLYVDIAVESGVRAAWDPKRVPFASVIRAVSREDVLPEQLFGVCTQFLREAFRRARLVHQQIDVTRAVVHALMKRRDGRDLVMELARNADAIFAPSPMIANLFKSTAVAALRNLVGLELSRKLFLP